MGGMAAKKKKTPVSRKKKVVRKAPAKKKTVTVVKKEVAPPPLAATSEEIQTLASELKARIGELTEKVDRLEKDSHIEDRFSRNGDLRRPAGTEGKVG